MTSRPFIAIAAVALVVFAFGCGGGKGDETSGASTGASAGAEAEDGKKAGTATDTVEGGGNAANLKPTPAAKAFIHRADALCRKAGAKIFADIEALFPKGGLDKATPEEKAEFVSKAVVPGLEAEIQELEALEPPPQVAEGMQEVLASMQTDANRASGDPATFISEGNPFFQTQEIAEKHGFEFCGGIGPKPAGS